MDEVEQKSWVGMGVGVFSEIRSKAGLRCLVPIANWCHTNMTRLFFTFFVSFFGPHSFVVLSSLPINYLVIATFTIESSLHSSKQPSNDHEGAGSHCARARQWIAGLEVCDAALESHCPVKRTHAQVLQTKRGMCPQSTQMCIWKPADGTQYSYRHL